MALTDPHDLERFVLAQEGELEAATVELRNGRKTGHWMWYLFPQVEGLGDSAMSRRFAIRSVAEAQGYLEHPVLGARLRGLTETVLCHSSARIEDIFGSIDSLKFRSSMTLFAAVSAAEDPFDRALEVFFDGKADQVTLNWLATKSRKE